MATYPAIQKLSVAQGQTLIVRARVTNSADERLVSDSTGFAGRHVDQIQVRVFDKSSATPTTALVQQIIYGQDAGDDDFSGGTYTSSNKTISTSGAWTNIVAGNYDVAEAQNEIFINETTDGQRGLYNVATLTDADDLILSTDIGGDATVSGVFYTIDTVLTADADTYLTEGWNLDDTGYNFLYALDPVVLGTSNQGGDWIAGHRYLYEARLRTDAAVTRGSQPEGYEWVRAEVRVEPVRAS